MIEDRQPPGTDGYPSGTDGYPSGTDGYPPDAATPSLRSSLGPAAADLPNDDDQPEEEPEGERKPYWAGFESPEAYFDHILAERAKVQRYLDPGPRRRQVPAPDFPGGDEIAGSGGFAGRQAAVRQVGVKLRPVDYDLLVRAAELYGVPPSTLARMLVRRGAQAIVARDS
jgi:hypothetical protein